MKWHTALGPNATGCALMRRDRAMKTPDMDVVTYYEWVAFDEWLKEMGSATAATAAPEDLAVFLGCLG